MKKREGRRVTDEPLDKLRRDLKRLSAENKNVGVEFLLEQLEEETARLVRLCAIPHKFNPDIMQTLTPDLNASRRDQLFEEIADLPLVVAGEQWMLLEASARRYLFGWWLEPERREEFVAVSVRLVSYYGAGQSLDSAEWSGEAERMFHLIGVNQDEGVAEFERLFLKRREESRRGECDCLVKSVHEYDVVLTPLSRIRLEYHQGLLAVDRCQWDAAATLFYKVVDSEAAAPRLRASSWDRLGRVYAVKREWGSAISCYRQAIDEFKSRGLFQEAYQVVHDLGVAYRDSNDSDLDEAERLLRLSIELSKEIGDKSWATTVYNSLGTLYLKMNDSEMAIKSYEESLHRLKSVGDRVGAAQVYNNIGLIYLNQEDWNASKAQFCQSLEMAQIARDTLTQAHAQANLGIVYANLNEPELAEKNLTEACLKYEEMRRPYYQAVASRRLARLYRRIERAELSLKSYSTAIKLFESTKQKAEAAATRNELNLSL